MTLRSWLPPSVLWHASGLAAAALILTAAPAPQASGMKIERVTSKVFLLSPAHVAVSGDQAEVEPDVDASFFAQS